MNRPRIKLVALLAVLGLATVGCSKENLVNDNDNVVVATITQSASYTVDGIHYYSNPMNDDEWSAFLDQMFALAEEGHAVQFWRNDNQRGNAAKEVVTFTTTDVNKAKKWAADKIEEGYAVSISYNQQTGEYTCIAIK